MRKKDPINVFDSTKKKHIAQKWERSDVPAMDIVANRREKNRLSLFLFLRSHWTISSAHCSLECIAAVFYAPYTKFKKDCIIFMRGNYEHVQDIFPQCVQLLTQRFCWRLFSFSQPFLFLLQSMFIFHMLLMYTQNSRSHVAKWPSRKKRWREKNGD